MGLETSKVPVVMSFETVVTVLVGIGVYAESAGAIKVLGIVLVLASILIMNTDFSKLRNSVFVGHVVESMTFKPNAWWTEKSQDMDLFKERTGIALEPTSPALIFCLKYSIEIYCQKSRFISIITVLIRFIASKIADRLS